MAAPKNQIRMVDIAKAAGCSTMTVSLALRGSHEVSEQTRERITKLAKKMRYRPNPYVSALIAQRKHGSQHREVEDERGLPTRSGGGRLAAADFEGHGSSAVAAGQPRPRPRGVTVCQGACGGGVGRRR